MDTCIVCGKKTRYANRICSQACEDKLAKKKQISKRTYHIGRVISDLKMIKGSFSHVPKNMAPNDDKGIYFAKAMHDLEKLIGKYEKLKEQYK